MPSLTRKEWAGSWLAAALFVMAFPYLFLKTAPLSWFLYYQRIEIVEPVMSGAPINLISFIGRPMGSGFLYFHDVLRCDSDEDGRFENYSNQSGGPVPSKPGKLAPFPWKFNARVPQAGARCFVESTVTYDLVFGPYHVSRILRVNPTRVIVVQ